MNARIPIVGPLGKMTRRFCAVTLFALAFAVFFGALVARGVAVAEGRTNETDLLIAGCVLAVACLVAMATLKQPWGVTLGWVLHLLTLISGLVVGAMWLIGALFLALWVVSLWQGTRMDELTRKFEEYGGPREGVPQEGVQ